MINCITSNFSNLSLSDFLIFSLELSDENEGNNEQYTNLIK